LLHGVAAQTRHAGQRCLTITSTHAKQAAVQAVLIRLPGFVNADLNCYTPIMLSCTPCSCRSNFSRFGCTIPAER
jgi:hypothetical protein